MLSLPTPSRRVAASPQRQPQPPSQPAQTLGPVQPHPPPPRRHNQTTSGTSAPGMQVPARKQMITKPSPPQQTRARITQIGLRAAAPRSLAPLQVPVPPLTDLPSSSLSSSSSPPLLAVPLCGSPFSAPSPSTAAPVLHHWPGLVTPKPEQLDTSKAILRLSEHKRGSDSGGAVLPVESADEAAARAQSVLDSALLSYIDSNVVGKYATTVTPFGVRRVVYADWTASGKPLHFIEDYLMKEVMPLYANTHTTSSITGLQTTAFRQEARRIALECMGGQPDKDCVLFAGSGCTAAVKLLIHLTNVVPRIRALLSAPGWTAGEAPALVVFLGPYEHHSNVLPWRELHRSVPCDAHAVQVVTVEEGAEGGVDLHDLEMKLRHSCRVHPNGTMRIGSFSAASNISGLLTDTDAVTRVLHAYGALSCWDYAGAAPYVSIDANPRGGADSVSKDAIFVSPHKFAGGPGCPGLLLVKKRLCTNAVPSTPAGGTVLFVTSEAHQYLDDIEEREEGGTPDILGSIRLGLVMNLKRQVGTRVIDAKEHHYAAMAMRRLQASPWITVVGHPSAARVCIFSFLVRFAPTASVADHARQTAAAGAAEQKSPLVAIAGQQYVHPAFISTLLNDLFGIQARAGCMCAGPYAARLLGMGNDFVDAMGHAIAAGHALLKPGFTRINLNWFVSEAEVDFLLTAVEWVAEHAWKFLPLYHCDASTGAWKHSHRTLPQCDDHGDDADWAGGSKAGARAKAMEQFAGATLKRLANLDFRARAVATAAAPASAPAEPADRSVRDAAATAAAAAAASSASVFSDCLNDARHWLDTLQSEHVVAHLTETDAWAGTAAAQLQQQQSHDREHDANAKLESDTFKALKWFLLPGDSVWWLGQLVSGDLGRAWTDKASQQAHHTGSDHDKQTCIQPIKYANRAQATDTHEE